jgi:hypothetical protein
MIRMQNFSLILPKELRNEADAENQLEVRYGQCDMRSGSWVLWIDQSDVALTMKGEKYLRGK